MSLPLLLAPAFVPPCHFISCPSTSDAEGLQGTRGDATEPKQLSPQRSLPHNIHGISAVPDNSMPHARSSEGGRL